jgi:hypothetical protein
LFHSTVYVPLIAEAKHEYLFKFDL